MIAEAVKEYRKSFILVICSIVGQLVTSLGMKVELLRYVPQESTTILWLRVGSTVLYLRRPLASHRSEQAEEKLHFYTTSLLILSAT
jgi:hypothetical protein